MIYDEIITLVQADETCTKEEIKITIFGKVYPMTIYTRHYIESERKTKISFLFPNQNTIVARVTIDNIKWDSILCNDFSKRKCNDSISVEFIAKKIQSESESESEISVIKEATQAFFCAEYLQNLQDKCRAIYARSYFERIFKNNIILN